MDKKEIETTRNKGKEPNKKNELRFEKGGSNEVKNKKPSNLLQIILIIVIILLAYSSFNLNQRVALLEQNQSNVTQYNISLLDNKISALGTQLDYVTRLAENANTYAHSHH